MPFKHYDRGRASLPLTCRPSLGGRRTARCEQPCILLLRLLPPIDVGELLERIRNLGVVQPQRDEAALGVGGIAEQGRVAFKSDPLRCKGVLRHNQDKRP